MYKKITLAIVLLIAIIAIPVSVYLVKQKQEIRKEAAGENQLVCDSGINRNDSSTIVVTNNTATTVPLEIQENLCPYAGQGVPVPDTFNCNDFYRKHFNSLQPGQTITFNMVVPDCKIGQLDVQNSDVHQTDDASECFNVRDNKRWDGGIAFAKKANPTGYNQSTQSCTTPTGTPTPTNTPIPGVTNTPTPTITTAPTNTPTIPIGAPTFTPAPTNTPRPTNTPVPTTATVATPTPTSPPPVSGNISSTILTIVAGGALVLLGILL